MTEPTDFARYQVLMWRKGRVVKLGIGVLAHWDLWGSDVHLARWALYDGDVLRAMYGKKWPRELSAALKLPFLEVVGEDRDGIRRTLSARGGGQTGESTRGRAKAGRTGRRPGSGLGVYVRHLRDEEGLEYPDILQAMLASGNPRFVAQLEIWKHDVDRLNALRRLYGQSKAAHAASCALCRRSNND